MARFARLPEEIDAELISEPRTVDTPHGTIRITQEQVEAGIWLLERGGEQWPCMHSVFIEGYEPAPGDAEAQIQLAALEEQLGLR